MTPLPTVLVTRVLPAPIMTALEAAAVLRVWSEDYPIPRQTFLDQVAGCDGLVCLLTDRVDAEILDAAGSSLKVVSLMAVGYDSVDVAACAARRIPVGNTPGVLTETTADLALALLLATARRVVEAAAFARSGQWVTWRPLEMAGRDLYGSIVGIVGLGRIGKAVARRLRGFDCRLLYTDPRPDRDAAALGAAFVEFDALLGASDFVTLHCPLNDATRGLIDAAALRKMKPGAILINTSRGPVVDQTALIEALRTGVIAGAGLDVTDPEPIAPDDPLLSMPNVVVLPHVGSATVATRTRMAQLAVDNLVAGLRGDRLPHCVNPQVYEGQ